MQVSRRGFAAGAAIGGGLLVAWWLFPRSHLNPLEPAEGEHAFDAWLKIAEDGVVTVAVPQLEMGQGITTLLPQIVAQELGADWRQIAVEPAAISGAYPNLPLAKRWQSLWDPYTSGLSEMSDDYLAHRFATGERFTATADGTSIAAYEGACRHAAATARALLAKEAASQWDGAWEDCKVARGVVTLGENSATFGDLAKGATRWAPPDPAPLRAQPPGEAAREQDTKEPEEATEATILFPRIDLPSKVDGTFQFAGDVRLPGMVYASVRHGPNDGSTLEDFDAAAAARVTGLVGVVKSKRWLAAAAETWWSAERALDAMNPEFTTASPVDSGDMVGRIDTVLTGGLSYIMAETGFGAEGIERFDFARKYEVDPAFAVPLETATATARFYDGRLDLWMASQAPEQARKAAASAIGLSVEDVALYPMPAGGSFDARLEHDHAIEIALIAYELEKPVQVSWSRRDELIRARPRCPAYMLLGAQISQDGEGALDGLRFRIAAPPANLEFGQRLFGDLTTTAAIEASKDKRDPLACEGAVPPYAIPSLIVEHAPVDIGLPVGRVRGNSHTYTCFAMESFIDEVARANDREPMSYRIGLLSNDIRMANCLQRAAQLAGWDGGSIKAGKDWLVTASAMRPQARGSRASQPRFKAKAAFA